MSTFVHMELNTSDPEAAKQFYEEVFGWSYQDMEMPDGVYTMISSPSGGIGGIMQNPMPEAPSSWLGYVAVDSVDRTVSTVEDAGGTVVMPATDIPNMGRFAVFTDPQGAMFAAWEVAAPGSAEQATEAPSKKKSSKKKSAGKKKSAAAAEPAEEEPEEQPASKRQTTKKASKKAAKKAPRQEPEEADDAEEAPPKSSKKATKKVAKKQPTKKAAKKQPTKKAAKKQPTKKVAKKQPTKKASKKTPKKTSKKTAKKR